MFGPNLLCLFLHIFKLSFLSLHLLSSRFCLHGSFGILWVAERDLHALFNFLPLLCFTYLSPIPAHFN